MYGRDARPSGGVIQVRAYLRNGQPVAAHTRAAPAGSLMDAGADRGGAARGIKTRGPSGRDAGGFGTLVLRRRSLLDDAHISLAAARRPDGGGVGDRKGVIPEAGGGGGGAAAAPQSRLRGQTPSTPAATAAASRREILEIVTPNGQPIGTQLRGATNDIRTLPGGRSAGEAMFNRITEGRIIADVTPGNYPGRMYLLNDGTVVGFRPVTSSGSPAIDINIPGFNGVTKLHF